MHYRKSRITTSNRVKKGGARRRKGQERMKRDG